MIVVSFFLNSELGLNAPETDFLFRQISWLFIKSYVKYREFF